MRDLMIDIETLGTRPGSVILSVAALEFDAETGEFGKDFYAEIGAESCVKYGMGVDVSTVKWWMAQSPEARTAAFRGTTDVREALSSLTVFYHSVIPKPRVWAKPPSFDIVHLERAYEMVGLDHPWHYKTPRCVRTIVDLAGIEPSKYGTDHNALDDCQAQAWDVIKSHEAIRAR